MGITLCPNCRERVVFNDYDNDVVHACNSGNLALDQEDVLKQDSWVDEETGDTVENGPAQLTQGLDNKLRGTDAGINGAKEHVRNIRGVISNMYRQRRHHEYIELK